MEDGFVAAILLCGRRISVSGFLAAILDFWLHVYVRLVNVFDRPVIFRKSHKSA